MIMTHPGLPENLVWGLLLCMLALSLWLFLVKVPRGDTRQKGLSLNALPLLGSLIRRMTLSPWPLFLLKLVMVVIFMTIIVAGLMGTPIPERNMATVFTWNLWWAGLIIAVFFLGSAWCAVCPWDAIATWLVRRRLWRRAEPNNSLNLKVPAALRTVWPALFMFMGLTWLELGVGVTIHPYATAVLSLFMIVAATAFLVIFEGKAFCHYVCPVGRTIGFYSQLAPVELRPQNAEVCASCTTLECYHGSQEVEPCPTHLVMGRLKQNTFCTSCGNCVRSCPYENVSWRLRPYSVEATQDARPHWDEAWFMLGLLALTSFHGLTMLPFWPTWMSKLASRIGDSGTLLPSFTIGMLLSMLFPVLLYLLCVQLARWWNEHETNYRQLFSSMAFVTLPLAFSYHIAHNLNHLLRENSDLGALIRNPLGTNTLPLSMMEKHQRMDLWFSQNILFGIQAAVMLLGFWIAIQVIRYRGLRSGVLGKRALFPILLFAFLMHGFDLWLLMQPMTMRM